MSLPRLHLAPGLALDVSDPHVLDLRYPGDAAIQNSLGRQLGQVSVGGDLSVDLPLISGTLVAGGVIELRGDVDANRVSGRVVHISGGVVRARALTASERLILGPCKLKVDVLLAPIIEIHPDASGRVTVIESRNERGPNKIKGGFSVKEYDEVFGDAEEFLRQRGVAPLGKPRVDVIPAAPSGRGGVALDDDLTEIEAEPLEDDEPHSDGLLEIVPEPLDEIEDDIETIDTLEPLEDTPKPSPVRKSTPTPPPPPSTPQFVPPRSRTPADDLGDPAEEDDGIIQAARPLPPRARTPVPPPYREVAQSDPAFDGWFARIDDIVEAITGIYEYPPEPVLELRGLAETRRVDSLEHGLNPVWADLVRHHRQTRTRLHPSVSHGFRVLSDLVAQAPGR